jgi:hypothetical protein
MAGCSTSALPSLGSPARWGCLSPLRADVRSCLYGRDREVAADLIAGQRWSEPESYSLALAGNLADAGQDKVASCLDDASFYAGKAAAKVEGVGVVDSLTPAGPYIAATFSGGHGPADRETYIKAVAAALDQAALVTGCGVVLLAHMSTPGLGDGDEAVHADIAAAMSTPVTAPPILSAEDTAALTARASMVITSRYHPVVFALDAGLPVVALACEDYSHARLNGALQNWGLGPLALTLPSLFDGTFGSAVEEAWKCRSDIAAHLKATRPVKAAEFARWWDRVSAALAGAVVGAFAGIDPNLEPGDPAEEFSFRGDWVGRDALNSAFFLPLSAETAELRVEGGNTLRAGWVPRRGTRTSPGKSYNAGSTRGASRSSANLNQSGLSWGN